MCHLLLADYEDVSSFLNQWKLNDSYIIYIHKQRALSRQFRILVLKALVPKRCVIFCWQVTDKDVSSFLNQWKLNDSYIVYIHKQRALSSQFRILLVKAFVPERCVIFCWQVMNMFYLFLTNGSKTTLILFIYTNNAR